MLRKDGYGNVCLLLRMWRVSLPVVCKRSAPNSFESMLPVAAESRVQTDNPRTNISHHHAITTTKGFSDSALCTEGVRAVCMHCVL